LKKEHLFKKGKWTRAASGPQVAAERPVFPVLWMPVTASCAQQGQGAHEGLACLPRLPQLDVQDPCEETVIGKLLCEDSRGRGCGPAAVDSASLCDKLVTSFKRWYKSHV
jgi:hypothetical protein